MNEENFGKLIKKLRTKNHLTQKEFADKYHVTYQAVSKWENGLNMPDTTVLKEICKDYNLDMENLLEGKEKASKKSQTLLVIVIILSIALITTIIISIVRKPDFTFSTLSTSCEDFTLQGSLSYNKNKSAIYINSVSYCGKDNNNKYSTLSCSLYEVSGNTEIKISSCENKENITLKDFLKDVSFNIDNYSKVCKEYSDNSLYLKIEALSKDGTKNIYEVPLDIKSC